MKNLFFLFLFTFFTTSLFAQKAIDAGEVVYKIELKDADPSIAGMMGDMSMKLQFGKLGTIVTSDMGMAKTTAYYNASEESSTVLMDVLGNKIQLDLSKEDMQKAQAESADTDFDIEYTGEEKTIVGYVCKKATMTTDEFVMDVYLTDQIVAEIDAKSASNLDFSKFDGFPLQFTMSQGPMKMEFIAIEVNNTKLKKSDFEIPFGYNKMSLEELEKMGMGGGGF